MNRNKSFIILKTFDLCSGLRQKKKKKREKKRILKVQMQFTRKSVSSLGEHFNFSLGHTKQEAGILYERTQIL